MSNWETKRLGEITNWFSGGTPKKDEPTYWNGDIPWISANSMDGTRYYTSDLKITAEGLKNGSRLAPQDALLLLVRGGALHTKIPVGIARRPLAFNQDVKAIVAKPEIIDPWFLLAWFMSNRDYLLNNVVEYTGIGAGKLDTARLQNLEINLPPIKEQKSLARILNCLEDKIELNQRMNETLESIAQALFKSWFVDFEPVKAKSEGRMPEGIDSSTAALFPSNFTESSLGLIPKGWEVTTVEEIAQQVAMGPFGSSIKVSTFVSEGIPVISGQHLNDVMLTDNEFNFVTEEHAEKLKKANVKRGDVIFTHAGNIGQVSYIPEDSKYERYVLSQRQFYLRCNEQKMSPLFMVYFFRSPEGQHKLLANASQTGVPSIARPVSYLRTITFTKPPNTTAALMW